MGNYKCDQLNENLRTKHVFKRKILKASQEHQNNKGKYWSFISEHIYPSFQSVIEKNNISNKDNILFKCHIKIT